MEAQAIVLAVTPTGQVTVAGHLASLGLTSLVYKQRVKWDLWACVPLQLVWVRGQGGR